MIKSVIWFLALLTLLSDGFIVVLGVLFMAEKLKFTKQFTRIVKRLQPISLSFAFAVALTATLGSLFFSEVAKFQPCVLCWYQRILMYPQSIILYLSIMRSEKVMKPYLMVISALGAGIAAYHYVLQIIPKAFPAPCSAAEGGVSCIKGYTFYFGYISIPTMSLTAFILILFFLAILRKDNSVKSKKQ